jgi:putative ribosome biogenesis GTPase RsgA
MSIRRKSKTKFSKPSQFEHVQKKRETEGLVDTLLEDFSENLSDPSFIVPLNEKCALLEKDLLNRSYILIGPTYTGKSSLIGWALRG